jgi:hypothetical protein
MMALTRFAGGIANDVLKWGKVVSREPLDRGWHDLDNADARPYLPHCQPEVFSAQTVSSGFAHRLFAGAGGLLAI